MPTERDPIWTFVNSKDQNQIVYVVGLDSAKFVASRLSEIEKKQWLVKTLGWDSMKKVIECPEIVSPPNISLDNNFLSSHRPFEVFLPPIGSTEKRSRSLERRKTRRVEASLKAMLFFEDQTFKVHTRNISSGGLFVDKIIPQNFVGKNCRILIGSSDNKINIEFNSQLKEVTDGGTRLQFKGKQSEKSLAQLAAWISQYENQVLGIAQLKKAA